MEGKTSQTMISDSQTNFVYLADTLPKKYPEFAKVLIEAFKKQEIDFDFLPHTKDVWAVDYMPVQVSKNKFIQFSYTPDYLMNKKYRNTISDVSLICKSLKLETVKSSLVIDGGNVVRGENYAILTEKIYEENKRLSESQLDSQLVDLLEITKLVIIPWDEDDWLGHSDGTVRRVSETHVLINDIKNKNNKDHQNLISSLENNDFTWEYLASDYCDNSHKDDATGLYLNYLETENHLFVPIYNREKDKEALSKLAMCFPTKTIVPVLANDIAKSTGVINCATWNVWK
jgi:agmatine deiminase